MHIADGVLSPEVCVATSVVSAGFVGYSLFRVRKTLADRTVPLTGMVASLIFAGQMVNFPLGVSPVSGHLIGGVLAGMILGPWAGCLAITLVLLVQCAMFSDGGLLSLGANILNMGVVGAIGGYAVYASVRRFFQDQRKGIIIGAVVASWLSVLAAASLFCLEFRLSWSANAYDFSNIFTLMVTVHAAIGLGEALITGSVIGFLLAHRPEYLIESAPAAPGRVSKVGSLIAGGVVFALAVAAFLAPFASEHPDGLEAVAERTEFDSLATEPKVIAFSDYELPLPFTNWQEVPVWQKVSVSLAGILGTLSVLLLGYLLSRPYSPLPQTISPGSGE